MKLSSLALRSGRTLTASAAAAWILTSVGLFISAKNPTRGDLVVVMMALLVISWGLTIAVVFRRVRRLSALGLGPARLGPHQGSDEPLVGQGSGQVDEPGDS